MTSFLGLSILIVLSLHCATTVQSQEASLSGISPSLNEGVTGGHKDGKAISTNNRNEHEPSRVAHHLAGLVRGHEMLGPKAVAFADSLSESARALASLSESFNSFRDQAKYVDEQLLQQISLVDAQFKGHITAIQVVLNACKDNPASSRCDEPRVDKLYDAFDNFSKQTNEKIEKLAAEERANSVNTSDIKAVALQMFDHLQSRIDSVSAQGTTTLDNLNATLSAAMSELYREINSSVQQQLCELRRAVEQQRADLKTLRADQQGIRNTCETLKVCGTTPIPGCPDGWTARETSCYYFVAARMDWEDAQWICRVLGGTLVEIENADEDTFVLQFYTSKGSDSVWIGLSDRRQENSWEWISGNRDSYTNWFPGQPDDFGGREDCVHSRTQHKSYNRLGWNDFGCDRPQASVCERRQ